MRNDPFAAKIDFDAVEEARQEKLGNFGYGRLNGWYEDAFRYVPRDQANTGSPFAPKQG
jgi:hypothetical protein